MKSEKWKTWSMMTDYTQAYTLSGMLFEPEEEGASMKLETSDRYPEIKSAGTFKLYYQKNNGTVMRLAKNGETDTLETVLPQTDKITCFEQKGEFSSVDCSFRNVDGGFLALGVAIEDNKGVVVDNYSLRGNSGLILNRVDSMQSVALKHTVNVTSAVPTVKLGASTLKLSTVFPGQSVATSVSLNQSNLAISDFSEFTTTAKEGTAAYDEAQKLNVYYDDAEAKIVASFANAEEMPKTGTYTFTSTPEINGKPLTKSVTIRVTVNTAVPTVKLSVSTLKLNNLMAGEETATANVTMTNSTGLDLQLTGFAEVDGSVADLEFNPETGELSVKLKGDTAIGKYVYELYPVIADAAGHCELLPFGNGFQDPGAGFLLPGTGKAHQTCGPGGEAGFCFVEHELFGTVFQIHLRLYRFGILKDRIHRIGIFKPRIRRFIWRITGYKGMRAKFQLAF